MRNVFRAQLNGAFCENSLGLQGVGSFLKKVRLNTLLAMCH